MDYTDYAACARAAEVQADVSKDPDLAESYRELAKCYEALAEQCERMATRAAPSTRHPVKTATATAMCNMSM
jgi:hypothetical protein